MNEVTLPPSPNWYLSRVLACANDGTIAWGARNVIVIARPGGEDKILKYSIIANAHTDRVTSLAFSPEFGRDKKNLLVSGGDEHVVRIWNLDDNNAVMAHSYSDVKQKVIGVDWSNSDPNLVCCVSSEGSLISWNVAYNIAHSISLGKLTATCISCCPHDSNLVAIGTKSGLVFIVDMKGSGTVTYKLRGHDVEIASLSWCPVDVNVLSGNGAKDLLLASGGKDRSIFIWKAGGDGRYQTEITLPSNPVDSNQHRSKLGVSAGGWTALCWVAPKRLLASSSWGELISWDLSFASKKKHPCKLIHACHLRGLFCIASVPYEQPADRENWRCKSQSDITVWTLAQDRQVVCCRITESGPKVEYNIPTQGGYVYCVAACPLDTSRIAFGVGDAMIRLWNLCEPHESTFDITMLWQKIKGKVRAISWHPEKENWLAFGTGEGRVGMFDTNANKPPILYIPYHRHNVYSIGWGPSPKSTGKVLLYSCGDGELVCYDPEKPSQDPKPVIKKECTEFAWKPDFACMALGFENGSISFVTSDLSECGRPIHSLKKAIQCLAWHPESTATDLSLSPLRNYLAVSINASTITIFDMSGLINSLGQPKNADGSEESAPNDVNTKTDEPPLHRVVATLNGHAGKIVSLAWSPHISGYLVSGSYDNTAKVWKIETGESIGTYTVHCGPVYCCMWSPLDPNLIITGSADFTVRIWKLCDQQAVQCIERPPTKRVRTKKNKTKALRALRNEASDKTTENDVNNSVTTDSDAITNTQGVEFSKTEEDLKIATKELKKKRGKKVSYFPSYAKLTNDKAFFHDSVKNLVRSIQEQNEQCVATDASHVSDEQHIAAPTIFGSKEELSTTLDNEKATHTAQDQHNVTTEMDVWVNNLQDNLLEAAKQKRLNDFLVSLAPSLSMKTWKEMCQAYAAQLVFEGNHSKAVSYFLCIHKIHRAIEVFTDAKMYKEAYVLARCKLDGEDPLFANILEEWATNAVKEGHFEDAALCYLKLGNFSDAAKYLGRRRDLESLKIAGELALAVDDEALCESLADSAIVQALLNSDCASAESVIAKFPLIKYREVHVRAFEAICKVLRNDETTNRMKDWISGSSQFGLLRDLKERYPNCQSHYANLARDVSTTIPESNALLWLNVSHQIALAVSTDDNEKYLSHIVTALSMICQFEVLHSLKVEDYSKDCLMKILCNLDARAPTAENSLFADDKCTITKSLRAYLCLGLLNWLVERNSDEIGEEKNVEPVLKLVEELLKDVLDRDTVKYWSTAHEVNKLEASLTAALGQSQRVDETGDAKKDTTDLVERLDCVRSERKYFVEKRVCAPSPILAYGKATDVASKLANEERRSTFMSVLSETWKKAVS